jgi:DNA-binding protein HU-beta
MTKTELVRKVSEATGLPLKSVRTVVDALSNPDPRQGLISASPKRGQKVIISGFGTFYARTRQSRKARNPRTGGKVSVPKRRYPAFKPARSLKEALKK